MSVCLYFESDRSIAVTDEPRECIVCGSSCHCFVNRDGRTRCFACDGAREEIGEERARAIADVCEMRLLLGYAEFEQQLRLLFGRT